MKRNLLIVEDDENIRNMLRLYTELSNQLNLSCYPTTIFVDSNGNIVGQTIFGALPEADYRAQIDAALAQVAK